MELPLLGYPPGSCSLHESLMFPAACFFFRFPVCQGNNMKMWWFFACRKKLEDSTRCSLCSRHWNTDQEEFQARKLTTVILQNLGFSQILWSVHFLSKSLSNTLSWSECIWQTSKLRTLFLFCFVFWKKILDNFLSNGKIELGEEELIEFLR